MGAAVVLTTDRCPVTGGAPTRMSETAFRSVCGKRRDGVWVDPGLGYAPFFSASKRCGECKGKRANWPEELDIIETEELDMGKKTGVCDICGERKELKHAARGGGLDVCTSCFGLLTAAGKPELMAKAVRLADAEEALAKALGGSAEGNAPDPAREQYELWMGKALHILGGALPPVDEGLDDTRSFADIMELAERAARKMGVDATVIADLRTQLEALKARVAGEEETLNTLGELDAELDRARATIAEQEERIEKLADTLGCVGRGEAEMEAEAADIAKAAKAWAALMDRARDCGFSEIADGDPVVMAGTYIMAINEVMAERDRLNAELKETRERIVSQNRRIYADPATLTVNDALLDWALKKVESGKLAVRVQVTELEEVAA